MRDAEEVLWVAVTSTEDELSNVTTVDADAVPLLALVAGRSSIEGSSSRTPGVIVGKTLYLLNTTVVPSVDDWFLVRGQRYDVEGEAHAWGDMGVEVAVTRVGPATDPPPTVDE